MTLRGKLPKLQALSTTITTSGWFTKTHIELFFKLLIFYNNPTIGLDVKVYTILFMIEKNNNLLKRIMKIYFKITLVIVGLFAYCSVSATEPSVDYSTASDNGELIATVGKPLTIKWMSNPPDVRILPGTTKCISYDNSFNPNSGSAVFFTVEGESNTTFMTSVDIVRSGSTEISLKSAQLRSNGNINAPQYYNVGNVSDSYSSLGTPFGQCQLTSGTADLWFWPGYVTATKQAVPGTQAVFTVTLSVTYYTGI